MLVFKNKSDVPGCMDEGEIREVGPTFPGQRAGALLFIFGHVADTDHQALHLDAIQTHRWTIMTCSAMTGMNLQKGLEWVVQDAKDRLFMY